MSKIKQIKSYFFTPNQCFIPRCKARCCTNAPLPDGFVESHKSMIQRPIYYAVNIGKNDYKDTFDSVIYNTTKNPIIPMGHGPDGKIIYGVPKQLLNEIGIKTEEEIKKLQDSYDPYRNYCPLITNYGRCSVYNERPIICREFGTLYDKPNRCGDKSSRFDIAKYWIKDTFNLKRTYNFYKDLILKPFKKA